MASVLITSWRTDRGTMETVRDFIYLFIYWSPKSLQMVTTTMKLKDTRSFEEEL